MTPPQTSSNEVNIAVDAMGGDYGPEVNIQGAIQALEASKKLKVALVGDRPRLLQELAKSKIKESSRLSIVHAEEVISNEDPAASAIRKKKNSSIHVGLRLVEENFVDAFISAGNSGAVMGCALMILGRLSDVERPAIVVKVPTATGFITLLDAGANVDCKVSHLVQFAEMGHVYAQVIEGIDKPRVGLLSNALESHKGNDLTRETHAVLKQKSHINYIGYVEGYDLFRGTTDIVVCDGFVGNVILKTIEGLSDTCF